MKTRMMTVALVALLGLNVVSAAPLLLRMSFNDEAGNASLTNRGLIATNGVLGGNAAYATDLPPVNTGGRSIEIKGGTTDKVSFGDRPELSSNKSLTVTAWIKPRAWTNSLPRILDTTTMAFWLQAQSGANMSNVTLWVNGNFYYSQTRLNLGEWRFVAATYDGTTNSGNLKFYVGDGTTLTLDSTQNASAGSSGVGGGGFVGGNSGTTRAFDGWLDDVRLYGMWEGGGGVLSSQQLIQVMQQNDAVAEDVSWIPSGSLYVAHGPDANSSVKRYAVQDGTATFATNLVTGINYARGLARASDGNLLVSERDAFRVLKSTNGLAPGAFPVFATNGATGMNKPRQIAVQPGSGHLYVAEYEDHAVSWYAANGVYISELTGLTNAHSVTLSSSNELYVVGNTFVRRFNWNGSSWTPAWTTTNLIATGRGITCLSGRLYVTLAPASAPSRILRLNPETGTVLASWFAGPTTFYAFDVDTLGNLYLSDAVGTTLYAHRLDANGDSEGFRRLATGIPSSMMAIVAVMDVSPQVDNASGATNISAASACLNGTLSSSVGGQAHVWVCWGQTDGGTNAANWANTNDFGTCDLGALSTNVSLPVSNRMYFYRFAASNQFDVGWASSSSLFLAGNVTVAATDAEASEVGPATGTFTISRPAGATNKPLTVYYTLGGSASNGVDHTTPAGSLIIPEGAASADVTVTPIPDTLMEPAETVVLTLAPGLYAVGASNAATVTIAANAATSPDTVSGLQAWLKSDVGVQTNASGQVTNWVDQSTNSWNVKPPSGNEPDYVASVVNGKPSVRFTAASSDYMELLGGATNLFRNVPGATLFAVVKHLTPATTGGRYLSATKGTDFTSRLHFGVGTAAAHLLMVGCRRLDADSTFVDIQPYGWRSTNTESVVGVWDWANKSLAAYRNGQYLGGGTPMPTAGNTENTGSVNVRISSSGAVGGSDFLNAHMMELIVFNRALNATEISQVNAYLAERYALTDTRVLRSDLPNPAFRNQALRLWLKGNAGVLTNASGQVTNWLDQSTWGNHVGIAAANAPDFTAAGVGGSPSVQFTRNNGDSLTNTTALGVSTLRSVPSATVLAALRFTATPTTGNEYLFFSGTQTNQTRAGLFAANGVMRAAGRRLDSDPFQTADGASPGTAPLIAAGVYDWANATLSLHTNGLTAAITIPFQTAGFTTDTNGSYGIQIGSVTASDSINAQIAEILVFVPALSTTDEALVGDYLARKYNITTGYNVPRGSVFTMR